MTLCIAAKCEFHGSPAVVASFDSRVETEIASGITEWKYERVSARWCVLLAGEIAVARELASLYGVELRSVEETLTPESALPTLYRPLNEMRKRLADRYVNERVAMSYDSFLERGGAQLPDDLFRTIAYDVASQELRAELLLIGWIAEEAYLFKVSHGRVVQFNSFSAVGSGAIIAEPNLFQRVQNEALDVAQTMYNVYESQKLGENAPGVGDYGTFLVLILDKSAGCIEVHFTSDDDDELLGQWYKKYGPRNVGNVKFPPGSIRGLITGGDDP